MFSTYCVIKFPALVESPHFRCFPEADGHCVGQAALDVTFKVRGYGSVVEHRLGVLDKEEFYLCLKVPKLCNPHT